MKTVEEVSQQPSIEADSPFSRTWWDYIDLALSRAGDQLNPILVKETRQALKSRQFTVSFWLVLLFGAGWSFLGIAMLMPSVYYVPSGRFMLVGYFVILCIPLLLVVPFSAYRSLAMEREDGTYELLSITSLSSRQIVTGKLGSSLMQMLVYYATLAPCIAFTYLLRGMDLGTILILLIGTFLVSVLLSSVGLVFAGMNQSRQWQALTSVLLLILLMAVGWGWGFWMISLVTEGRTALDAVEFWYGVGFYLTMYATFLTLLILVAAAQNSFASANRSTKIRATMLTQLVLYTTWMVFLWIESREAIFAPMSLVFGGIAWTFYGALLTGEVADLSPRARRDLPQSFFGRTFLTWFNPGSATGYIFTLTSFLTFVLLILTINTTVAANAPGMAFNVNDLMLFGLLMWAYMAFYLGLGRLMILWLRKLSDFGLASVLLIHILVLTVAATLPTFIQFWMQNFRAADYSRLQTINWMWSLVETLDGSWAMRSVVLTVGFAGCCMFALNLVLATREVEATRLETPERVLGDDYSPQGLSAPFETATMGNAAKSPNQPSSAEC